MSVPLAHSSLGPSSWSRWIRCPGSVHAQQGIPDAARYEAAEGTVFHELMSDCLEFGLEPEFFLGERNGLSVDGHWVPYDESMCDYGRDGLDFVRAYMEDPNCLVFIETRVDISPWTLPGQFGTADVVIVNLSERWIIVFDWKYGKEPVYPQENYQLYGYSLGTWQTIAGELFEWDAAGIDVTFIIEQPRVPGAGGAWKTTMSRVLEFGDHAKRQAVLAQGADAKRVPGREQCRWCRAKDFCGAFAAWELEMIGIEMNELDGVEPPELDPPEDLTPERRSMLLRMRPMISQWLDALHKAAYHDATVGNPVPGLKLVEGRRPPRKWDETQVHKAERVLKTKLGEEAYHPPKLISPAESEKVLGKARYGSLVERFVDQGSPQPTLVPEQDRRDRIESAVDMFDDLDATDEIL